ncbi:hypothetical protein SCUCBS95973_001032 [Sporothrix curviconia]|uniref:Uncharacterized protein n=1 Tax=Sporothrix curviconia TaxID=1260050 RepID=A0ABP0AV67_9PEZI
MRTGQLQTSAPFIFASLSTCSWLASVSASAVLHPRNVDVASAAFISARDSAPTPLDNKAYLPAQVGGIVGSYALCLVVVAFALLLLSKRRRAHLQSGEDFDFAQPTQVAALQFPETLQLQDSIVPFAVKSPTFGSNGFSNFSYPNSAITGPTAINTDVGGFASTYSSAYPAGSPISATETHGGTIVSSLHAKENLYLSASYASSFRVPGVDPSVDQEIVTADREMAQSQLEEMYKYVMEQEEAKANGVVLDGPPAPLSPQSYASHGSSSNPYGQQPNPGANVGFNNPSTSSGNFGYAANHSKNESTASSTATLIRKEKNKPTSLNLSLGLGRDSKDSKDGGERTSRTSSILSALKSPRNKKKMQGISISSPIMTPMSGTFPRFAPAGGPAPGGFGYGNGGGYAEAEEMSTIPPRHYAPAAPPPIPQQQPTPETSPLSTLSIDERIGAALVTKNLPPPRAFTGMTPIDQQQREPESAVSAVSAVSGISATSTSSADSSAPLVVGLPTSPKPGVNRFPSLSSLPASPRATKTTFFQQPPAGAGAASSSQQNQPLSPTGLAFASASPSNSVASSGFSRANAPSALRTGGGLPLRAYEPSITSPSFATHNQTKQTVFERTAPLSPGGPTTPWTGAPVPYSPYQPFSPVVPMTPSLVTKEDRKRMRRLEPKTPTMSMVPSIDDTW